MSTTAVKPMQPPTSQQQEVKVFFKPRFGIRAQGRGLSVDVSAGLDQDKEKSGTSRG